MHLQVVSAALLATAAIAIPTAVEQISTPCTSGAVIFAVRGSDYSHTTLTVDPAYTDLPSGMTNVANAVISKAGSGSLNPIPYPAINPDYGYHQSVGMGIFALQTAIYNYTKACANGKIFVLGHSQGAQVVGGALAGSEGYPRLNAHGRLTGAAITADPTYHDGEKTVDAGSGANNGHDGTVVNATKYDFLQANFGAKLRSYCQAGDKYCDSGTGSDAQSIHDKAPSYFQADETTFLNGLL